ncbi:MAG: hypothetical protein J6S85_09825 [Methanobrevibacter sp.]|nr:hypothetical protein [Methanobrevibacter sp.]
MDDKKNYLYAYILQAERLLELEKKAGINTKQTTELLKDLVEQRGSYEYEEILAGLKAYYAEE